MTTAQSLPRPSSDTPLRICWTLKPRGFCGDEGLAVCDGLRLRRVLDWDSGSASANWQMSSTTARTATDERRGKTIFPPARNRFSGRATTNDDARPLRLSIRCAACRWMQYAVPEIGHKSTKTQK